MNKSQYYIKGWQRCLLILIPYIIVVGCFGFVGGIISGVKNFELHHQNTPLQDLIISFSNLLGTIGLLWLFVRIVDNEPLVDIGLKLKKRGGDILLGLLIGLVVMGGGLLLLDYLNEIEIKAYTFDLMNLLWMTGLFICVSFLEELFIRGYILRNLMYSYNKLSALLISSLFFALMHSFNPNMSLLSYINLFLAGILLGISYVYTKNLWLAISLHFSWNFFQSLFGFNVSGIEAFSLVELEIVDANVLNGGAFGFENSVIVVVLQVVLILALYSFYSKRFKTTLTGQTPKL